VQVLWYLTTKPLMQNESNRWDVSSVSSLVALSLLRSNALSERDTAPSTNLADLHEWRNDFPTVSTTDPAKLKYE